MTTRIALLGGFLGSGKTTLLLHAAARLTARGARVGMVTNDQGHDLVDTALAGHQGVPVVEVAGGCFCCRFPDLLAAIDQLEREAAPDFILAEPVGSCTDLLATVVRPLLFYYPERFVISPLSVLVDPLRDLAGFPAPVQTLHHNQLAEAEAILLAKMDLLEPAQRQQALDRFDRRHAPTPIYATSGRTGAGVDRWLDVVTAHTSRRAETLQLDYAEYAEAEAQLGWLNAKGMVKAERSFSARNWLAHLLATLDDALAVRQAPVAHIKAQAVIPGSALKASLTGSGGVVTWDLDPETAPTNRLQFVLNARVLAAPAVLEGTVRQVFAELMPEPDFRYQFTHFECFRPAPPRPTYRMA